MTLEPIVFFELSFAIFILAGALGVLVISYAKTLEKFPRSAGQKKESDIESDAKSDLAEAHKKASLILEEEARNEAAKKQLDQELKRISEGQVKTLEKLSYDLLNVYQKELADLKEHNIKMMNTISKDIENSTIADLKDFREILKKETLSSQKIVESKIEEAYQATQKEIEDYKLERIKKVEDKIYEMIKNVSTLVLGKSISLDEHEQLVIDALEKAKEAKMVDGK